MKQMLIVTTISGFVPQFESNNLDILRKMGYQVHYASDFNNPVYKTKNWTWKERGIIPHQIEIRKNPLRLFKQASAVFQLRKIIDQEKIELIHCHNPMGGVTARLAARGSRQRPYVIYTAHGFHFYKGAPLLNWLLFYTTEKIYARITDCIVTINQEDFRRAKSFVRKQDNSTIRIPGAGIDLERFQPRPWQRDKKRAELGIPGDAFHVVSVGELNKNKNHETVLKAIRGMDKKVHLTICGEGCRKQRLRKRIQAWGMSGQVHLLGYRKDIPEILQTADCFVFPSRREGLGMAAIEAMACGIPVIAADNRGSREYMEPGKNGIFCRFDKALDFRTALGLMRELSRESEAMRLEKIQRNCRQTAERFAVQKTGEIMYRVYDRAKNRKNGKCLNGAKR